MVRTKSNEERLVANGICLKGRDSILTVEVTTQCHKKCLDCYSLQYPKRCNIQEDAFLEILSYARQNFKYVLISGGEPFLYKPLLDLIKGYPDIFFYCFTNGIELHSQALISRLASLENFIPMLSISSIVDLQLVESLCHNLHRHKIKFGAMVKVRMDNYKEVLSETFIHQIRELQMDCIRYIEFFPYTENSLEQMLDGHAYEKLTSFRKWITDTKSLYTQDLRQKHCGGVLYLDTDLNAKLCPFFHYSFANWRDTTFEEKLTRARKTWINAPTAYECPVYSIPHIFSLYLLNNGFSELMPRQLLTRPEHIDFIESRYACYHQRLKE